MPVDRFLPFTRRRRDDPAASVTRLADAIDTARRHAEEELRTCPFDAVCIATLRQLAVVTAALRDDGTLAPLPRDSITLGIMAAKELGSDDRDFAHALHVVQWHVDAAGRRSARNGA